MNQEFKVGDLVQVCGCWAEIDVHVWEDLPRGIVTGFSKNSVHVYWFDERMIFRDEDPNALKLLSLVRAPAVQSLKFDANGVVAAVPEVKE